MDDFEVKFESISLRLLLFTWSVFVLASGNGLKLGLDPFGDFVEITFSVDATPGLRLGTVTKIRSL